VWRRLGDARIGPKHGGRIRPKRAHVTERWPPLKDTGGRIAALRLLHPEFAGRLAQLLGALGTEQIPLAVFETARSPMRQEQLYARGRDPMGADYGRTVTRARAYESAHQWGLAADLVFLIHGQWTWDEPGQGQWARMGVLAHQAGLETLSFERPHVQVAGFVGKDLARLRGPTSTDGWLAWLEQQAASYLGKSV
jgi:peptidoglycan LD-endopeptidase CwlK